MWLFRELWFWLTIPFWIALDAFGTGIGIIGGGAPQMQTIELVKHHWYLLCGNKVTATEITGRNGYLYWEYTYSNSAKVLFRD